MYNEQIISHTATFLCVIANNALKMTRCQLPKTHVIDFNQSCAWILYSERRSDIIKIYYRTDANEVYFLSANTHLVGNMFTDLLHISCENFSHVLYQNVQLVEVYIKLTLKTA